MINTANFGFAVSSNGDVVHGVALRLDSSMAHRLTLTDATGRAERPLALRMPWSPRFSPDGRRLAVVSGEERAGSWWRSACSARLAQGAALADEPALTAASGASRVRYR
jgi:hypothetical protein